MNQLIKSQNAPVRQIIESQKAQILAALPKHLNADRFVRIVLTEIRKNPLLEKSDPLSFMAAVIQSAQLGLELGSGLGLAYLIPYKNNKKGIYETQLIIGYKGLLTLARQSGYLASIAAHVVFEDDKFQIELGDEERIIHQPTINPTNEKRRIVYAYAIAKLKDGSIQRAIMSRAELEDIRHRGRPNPVWETDFPEMAKKTVIRRLAKLLPLSPEMRDAFEIEETETKNEVNLDLWQKMQNAPDQYSPTDLENERHIAMTAFNNAWQAHAEPEKSLGKSYAAIVEKASNEDLFLMADKLAGEMQ